MLCIEHDEGQLNNYIQINEESRYNDLFMDFNGVYIYIFIRYNPDSYRDENGNKRNPLFDKKRRCNYQRRLLKKFSGAKKS